MLFLAAHSSRLSLVMPLNLPFIDIWWVEGNLSMQPNKLLENTRIGV